MNLIGVDRLMRAGRSSRPKCEKVIVVNPPSPPGFVANRDSQGGYGQLYPIGAPTPIALDVPYLVGSLAAKSAPVEVVEAQALGLDGEGLAKRVAEIAAGFPPQSVLVVTRIAICCLDWDLSMCAAIKTAAPNVLLAIWGPIVAEVQRRAEKEPALDFILHGEPDETVYELASGKPESEILGLQTRQGGGWTNNPSRPLKKNLDELPFPAWERLPYRAYTLPKSSATAPIPYLPMLTSRGCPFGCHYCPYPVAQGLPFRFRSPQNVADELEHLVRDLGIRYIIFRDPMFSLRQDRVLAICEEIQRRKINVRWKCETRVDCLNEATLRAMASAGCEGINFGIESADVEIQAGAGRKPITQQKIEETVALCRKMGIKTFCFFIIGLPGDTVDTILASIRFAIRLQPTWVQFNAASPLVGTKLRQWAITRGLVEDEDYSYRTCHEASIGNENLTKEQVASLYRFAVVFERYLINRGGILKDETRKVWWYTAGRAAANRAAALFARAVFAIGRLRFARGYGITAPPANEGVAQ